MKAYIRNNMRYIVEDSEGDMKYFKDESEARKFAQLVSEEADEVTLFDAKNNVFLAL